MTGRISQPEHYSVALEANAEEWFPANCSCGWQGGIFPTAEAGILEALHSFGIAYAHTHIAPAIEVVAVTLCEENFTANSQGNPK